MLNKHYLILFLLPSPQRRLQAGLDQALVGDVGNRGSESGTSWAGWPWRSLPAHGIDGPDLFRKPEFPAKPTAFRVALKDLGL